VVRDYQLKQAVRRFDKAGILRKRGVQYDTVGEELFFNCPFCDDTRRRMYLNSRTGKAYCHNCGYATNNFIRWMSEFTGYEYSAVYDTVINGRGVGRPIEMPDVGITNIELPDGFKLLTQPATPEQKAFWNYLRGRDIPASTVIEYGIGYVRTGFYSMRVVIPYTYLGELVGWGARSIFNRENKEFRKILHPKGSNNSQFLINIDKVIGNDRILLVEGPFDMLKLPDIAVASSGKHLSNTQLAMLLQCQAREITLGYDTDAWAIERGRKSSAVADIYSALSKHTNLTYIEFEEGKDPGNTPEPVLRDKLLHAKPLTLSTVVGKTRKRVT